jgi:hypothetical protein
VKIIPHHRAVAGSERITPCRSSTQNPGLPELAIDEMSVLLANFALLCAKA